MKTNVSLVLAAVLLLSRTVYAQTGCGAAHTGPGVYICYPNPSKNAPDVLLPYLFHLSAQANASDGRTIQRYKVLVDGRVLYENRLATSATQLSIEINLKSPFESGNHRLSVVVEGTGEAQVSGLRFYAPANDSFCDPVSSFEVRTCQASNIRSPLQWPINNSGPRAKGRNSRPPKRVKDYANYLERYRKNLASLEADIADAVAVDSHGTLYAAFHSSADVELRKYAPDGSVQYDALVRACGLGFLAITGLAIDDAGSAWIAGNTNACLPVTGNAWHTHVDNATEIHGFILLMDTRTPISGEPRYLTYLSGAESRINAIRVDGSGNAYVAGVSGSIEYPHDAVLTAMNRPPAARHAENGFVSVLNASGSGLLWSTLLPHTQLTAITQDGVGNVFVTGSVASARPCSQVSPAKMRELNCDDAFVAALSDRGRRLSYFALLGAAGAEEGRAISMTTNRHWVLVSGETDSPEFPATSTVHKPSDKLSQSFIVALEPCRTGLIYTSLVTGSGEDQPEIAIAPALDAFTRALTTIWSETKSITDRGAPFATIQIAPACPWQSGN